MANAERYIDRIRAFTGVRFKRMRSAVFFSHDHNRYFFDMTNTIGDAFVWKIKFQGKSTTTYVLTIEQVYHIYLTRKLNLPTNFGKIWNEVEDKLITDSLYFYSEDSILSLAYSLSRTPAAVAERFHQVLDERLLTSTEYSIPFHELGLTCFSKEIDIISARARWFLKEFLMEYDGSLSFDGLMEESLAVGITGGILTKVMNHLGICESKFTNRCGTKDIEALYEALRATQLWAEDFELEYRWRYILN